MEKRDQLEESMGIHRLKYKGKEYKTSSLKWTRNFFKYRKIGGHGNVTHIENPKYPWPEKNLSITHYSQYVESTNIYIYIKS